MIPYIIRYVVLKPCWEGSWYHHQHYTTTLLCASFRDGLSRGHIKRLWTTVQWKMLNCRLSHTLHTDCSRNLLRATVQVQSVVLFSTKAFVVTWKKTSTRAGASNAQTKHTHLWAVRRKSMLLFSVYRAWVFFSSLNISYPWLANCQGLLVPRRKGLGLGGGSVVKHTPCTPSNIEKMETGLKKMW